MATIHTRIESARGCGYRKGGGLYLVSDGVMVPCGKLPIPLDVCPVCDHGIHPSRGWTWIDIAALSATAPECAVQTERTHLLCPLNGSVRRSGLLWVGEEHYATPEAFLTEAQTMGVSRRISKVPRDFVLGQTWVFFAHRKCFGEDGPGIFHAFMPKAIEYVVTGEETEEELDRLESRGLTLVKVVRADGLFDEEVDHAL